MAITGGDGCICMGAQKMSSWLVLGYYKLKREIKAACVCGSENQIILSEVVLRGRHGISRLGSVGWEFAGRDSSAGRSALLLQMRGGGWIAPLAPSCSGSWFMVSQLKPLNNV